MIPARAAALLLLVLLVCVPEPAQAGSAESGWTWSFVWVSGDPAHVRTRPGEAEASVGTLARGERVRVRREKNPGAAPAWLLAAVPGTKAGWVLARQLSTARVAAAPAAKPPAVVPAARTGEKGAAGRSPITSAKVDTRALTAPGPGGAIADDPATDLATLQAVVDALYPPQSAEARARDMSAFLRDLP